MTEQEVQRCSRNRLRFASLVLFVCGFLFCCFSFARYLSAKESTAETQMKLAVLYGESASESAVDLQSLEQAKDDFVLMIRKLAKNIQEEHAVTFFESGKIRSTRTETVKTLESIATDLESTIDAKAGIDTAKDRLSVLYLKLDGAFPLAIRLGLIHSKNGEIRPEIVSHVRAELAAFDSAVRSLESCFPLPSDFHSSEVLQASVVRAGEVVCQDSRICLFEMSLLWEDVGNRKVAAEMLDEFVSIERRALSLCNQLNENLPDGSKRDHVTKFTKSVDRRLRAAESAVVGDWQSVFAILSEPFAKSGASGD